MSDYFRLEQAIDFAPPEEIRQIQTKLLNEHLARCRSRSPFYRRRFAGLPEREVSLEELALFPTTSKQDLAECNDDFTAVPEEEISDISFTSGTTGVPCRICYTRSDLDRLGYNDALGFLAAGMRAGDRVLLTCTIDRCFIAGLAYYNGVVKLGAAAIRNGLNTIESHAEIIRFQKPQAVVGVPSFLVRLGNYLRENRIDDSSIRTLVCIGEPMRNRRLELTPLGERLNELWPDRIHSTYASSEIVTSFTECSARSGGHPPADLAIVEILDEAGKPLPPGVPGEVTVTPLQVTGMPLVRFRTGDVSFLVPEPCPCGRRTLRLGPVLGRKAQMLKIRGTTLFPNSFFAALDGMPEVAEYYLEVSGRGLSDEVEIFVALKEPGIALEEVAARLYGRTRIHVPVRRVRLEDAHARVFGVSRKPVRFFDRRITE